MTPTPKQNQARTVAKFVEDIEILTHEIQQLYCLDEVPWVVGYSGGKIQRRRCSWFGMRSQLFHHQSGRKQST